MTAISIFISNGVIEYIRKDSGVIVTVYEHDDLRDENDLKEFREMDRVVRLDGYDYVVTEY